MNDTHPINSTRGIAMVLIIVILAAIAGYGMFKGLNDPAMAAIGGLLLIAGAASSFFFDSRAQSSGAINSPNGGKDDAG